MADIIHLLPDAVANQIAAGEVIQRPASAVKELLENAIDAGAAEISLIIKDAGKTLIQIVDNGCGMSERDARMCFERHATSKIQKASDLFAIRTLGFRGEALASITAVAQVEIKTRRHEDDLGTWIELEGTTVKRQQDCSCPKGTTILVKNLFFNVPARRSFLKTDPAEFRHITDEFFRVSLVYNEVKFTFHHNGQLVYQLLSSPRKQRIMALFGNQYNERLVPVEQVTEALSVTGFIGKPEFAKKTRGEQFFFVNGRYIRHPYLHHSLESAYFELIPKDAIPSYFIYLQADPATIDVNIHPTKTEVNFLDSKVIYAVLKSSVRQALGMHNLSPSIDFNPEPSLDFSPLKPGEQIKNPFDRPPSGFNPFDSSEPPPYITGRSLSGKLPSNWETLYGFDLPDGSKQRDEVQPEILPSSEAESTSRDGGQIFQFHQDYLATSISSGLVIIHVQRAHERILYERFMDKFNNQQATSQQDLFPHQVSFSPADAEIIDELTDELTSLGFNLNKLGIHTFVVTGSPAGTGETDIQGLLESILNNYKKNITDLRSDKKINLARSMASSLSIRPGRQLHQEEMSHLVGSLFSCAVPDRTPDGKIIYTVIPIKQINNLLNNKQNQDR